MDSPSSAELGLRITALPWMESCPEQWKIVRPKTIFRRMQRPVRPEDGVVTAFRDGVVTLRKNRRTTGFTEALQEIGYQGIRKGDLVIHAMDAFAGAIGVSDSDGKGTPVYSVCQPTGDANSWYYALMLREMSRSGYLLSLAKGIRERSTDFRFADFASLLVPLPPLEEQVQIVRFVQHLDSRVNRLVKAKRRLIELLNEQKQAIIHQAVTRGLDPTVPLKPSGIDWLGDVPANWDVLPLSQILKERKEKNNPIKTRDILSLGLNTGVIPYGEKTGGGNKAKEDLSAYMLAYPGDIVVNSMNVVVGSVGLSKYFGAVSPVYYMLHPRYDRDKVEFFDAVFHSPVFQMSLFGLGNGIMFIESKSSGKLNTIRLRIPMRKLNRVLLPYPPADEQEKIVAQLEEATKSVGAAISKTQAEIDLIREYRTRLVADVVTGQLDVRQHPWANVDPDQEDAALEAVPDDLEEEMLDESESEELSE